MDKKKYLFAPPVCPALPVKGTDRWFPIHRIYCVARNYADHAAEMGHDSTRETPFFFQKNTDNVVLDGHFPYPAQSKDVHHEIELMVALDAGGKNLTPEAAEKCIFGYGVALDMTCRDLQAEAKKQGRPWDIAKAFDSAMPCSALVKWEKNTLPEDGAISLTINGVLRQNGNLNQMIWKIPEIIAYLSRYFTLQAGDIILTGTPAGVGPVHKGDQLSGYIAGIGDLDVTVF